MAKKKTSRKKTSSDSQSDRIAQALQGTLLDVPLGDIRPNAYNYNRQSSFVFDKTVESLKMYGFVEPLVVRSSNEEGPLGFYEIIGGEHRLKAAEQLKYDSVPCVDLGKVTDRRAKILCIVLNETKGKPDPDALATLIADLGGEGTEDMSVLPYDESEIDAFIESVNVSWDDDVGGIDPEDVVDPVPPSDKKTLVGIMGIIEISKKKEEFLISRFEKCMKLSKTEKKPIRCLEIMMDLVDEAYS